MTFRLATYFTIRGGAVLLLATLLAHVAVMASPLHAHAVRHMPDSLEAPALAMSATAGELDVGGGHAEHESVASGPPEERPRDSSGRGAALQVPAHHPGAAHCALSPAPAPAPPRIEAPRPLPWASDGADLAGAALAAAAPRCPAVLGRKPPGPPGAAALRTAQALLQVFRN